MVVQVAQTLMLPSKTHNQKNLKEEKPMPTVKKIQLWLVRSAQRVAHQ